MSPHSEVLACWRCYGGIVVLFLVLPLYKTPDGAYDFDWNATDDYITLKLCQVVLSELIFSRDNLDLPEPLWIIALTRAGGLALFCSVVTGVVVSALRSTRRKILSLAVSSIDSSKTGPPLRIL